MKSNTQTENIFIFSKASAGNYSDRILIRVVSNMETVKNGLKVNKKWKVKIYNKNAINKDILEHIKNNEELVDELIKESNKDFVSIKVERDNKCTRYIKLGICIICKKRGIGSEHHIIPREKGGSNDNENKIFTCSECHDYVEMICEMCKNNIKSECDKDLFTSCWFDGYPLYIKRCDMVNLKAKTRFDEIESFKCKKCKRQLIRIDVWDKENYLSNKWNSTFKCTDCNIIYKIQMEKEKMDWVIDNIHTVLEPSKSVI